jgi:CNP1-like family protein
MRTLPILPLLGAAAALAVETSKFDEDFDLGEPWSKLQAQLPAYPKDGDLIAFNKHSGAENSFFIDAGSIAVEQPGVIRYTLVIKSSNGVTNVTYEGMRCDTREYRVYALGRSDRTWAQARFTKWEKVQYKSINNHRNVLYADFFCPKKKAVATAGEAINALREGFNPQAEPHR